MQMKRKSISSTRECLNCLDDGALSAAAEGRADNFFCPLNASWWQAVALAVRNCVVNASCSRLLPFAKVCCSSGGPVKGRMVHHRD